MKERPILFSGSMVRAILEDRKTQTRRIVKPQPPAGSSFPYMLNQCSVVFEVPNEERPRPITCPHGRPKDRLWVKETYVIEGGLGLGYQAAIPTDRPWKRDESDHILVPHYRATEPEPHIVPIDVPEFDDRTRWRPSIFMPRWASRITLEVVSVRVERLQGISEADAKAEGAERGIWCNDGVFCEPMDEEDEVRASYRHGYGFLWESINGRGSWAANPWVWVIDFRRI